MVIGTAQYIVDEGTNKIDIIESVFGIAPLDIIYNQHLAFVGEYKTADFKQTVAARLVFGLFLFSTFIY